MGREVLALYKIDGNIYILQTAYENISKLYIGFKSNNEPYNGIVYVVKKLSDKQKELLNSFYREGKIPPEYSKIIFGNDFYAKPLGGSDRSAIVSQIPKVVNYGRHNNLVGGGAIYRITKEVNRGLLSASIRELLNNESVTKALMANISVDESRTLLRKIIREAVNTVLTKKDPDVGFTAVSIEDEKEKEKINKVFDKLKEDGQIPESFKRPAFKNGDLDYHMTITLGELPLRFMSDLNEEVELNINTLGISNEAVALGVSGNYFSSNRLQHIILAFRDLPQSSKDIKEWISLERPFSVVGVIREFTSRKGFIKRGGFDEANQIQIGNFQAQAPPAGSGSSFPKEKEEK